MAGKLSAATATGGVGPVSALCRHLEFFAAHPALAVTPLSNGELNLNYQVETCRGMYALRRYPASSSGVCRQQELRCQHAAAVAGIAPAPLCLNNHLQVLISEFIQGGSRFEVTTQTIPILACTLAKLHKLRTRTALLQPVNYLQQLAQHVAESSGHELLHADAPLFARLLRAAKHYQTLPTDEVLCHLDLHGGNMLWAKQKLWLLDFEYAQSADSCLDLAAVSLNFQLSAATEQQLLAAYQQHRAIGVGVDTALSAKLVLAKIIFSGFCWLWYLSLQQKLTSCQQQAQYWQQQLTEQLALQPS
ncbi:MAG: choline kinase [Rheinheimera sp.]|uniref:phosphotransferase family protein n=1 Tax=Arsukibacterium sp. UBA3155 TaxID=1946058 RepID=UPI000C91C995|nr:phosphotransferase [Arsukibacterium sp. UBA3155]MAD75722.1 choline kinase [Rheinheimera sp.]|tara:strand:- start:94874 stop:95785 length:912 start_codon:yes stop_codon:yes gene_type:complete